MLPTVRMPEIWRLGVAVSVTVLSLAACGDQPESGTNATVVEDVAEVETSDGAEVRPTQEIGTPEPAAPATDAAQEPIEVPEYRIAKVDDVSIANAKRFAYHVVVEEQISRAQMESVARDVVEVAKIDTPFNALVIGFYDYEAYIGHGYVLGKVELAPGGDWSRAADVRAGEYDRMSFKTQHHAKNWTSRLTPTEVEVWTAWQKEYDVRDAAIDPASLDLVDEEAVDAHVAGLFGMDPGDVSAIVVKQLVWVYAGNN